MSKNIQYGDLSPTQKNKMARSYGYTGKNPYRTLDSWVNENNEGKIKLINLMVKDFFHEPIILDKKIAELEKRELLGRYELLPDVAELEKENETSPFIDDELFDRRKRLISIRNKIYGIEL